MTKRQMFKRAGNMMWQQPASSKHEKLSTAIDDIAGPMKRRLRERPPSSCELAPPGR
jgi:hypothetical protein